LILELTSENDHCRASNLNGPFTHPLTGVHRARRRFGRVGGASIRAGKRMCLPIASYVGSSCTHITPITYLMEYSDKICRWNALGLQGSLLSRYIGPIYMDTLTVGRKLTRVCCERAVCCRIGGNLNWGTGCYHLQHPTVLGTDVYVNENAVVDMTNGGEEIRFHTSDCWAWWDGLGDEAECIDGNTGLTRMAESSSAISTASLVDVFVAIAGDVDGEMHLPKPRQLQDLRAFKHSMAFEYEQVKELLLSKHPTLRDWKRRVELAH